MCKKQTSKVFQGLFTAVAWLLAGLGICFSLYVATRTTVYIEDTGWRLYSIWAASHGQHWFDFLSSVRPGYLLATPFAFGGISLLLPLRLIYLLCLWSLLAMVLWRWLAKNKQWYWAVPLIIAWVGFTPQIGTDLLFGYYTDPMLGLLWALLWIHIARFSNREILRPLYWVLASLGITLIGSCNFGLIPAAIIVALGWSIVYWRYGSFWLLFGFLGTFTSFFVWYLFDMGVLHELLHYGLHNHASTLKRVYFQFAIALLQGVCFLMMLGLLEGVRISHKFIPQTKLASTKIYFKLGSVAIVLLIGWLSVWAVLAYLGLWSVGLTWPYIYTVFALIIVLWTYGLSSQQKHSPLICYWVGAALMVAIVGWDHGATSNVDIQVLWPWYIRWLMVLFICMLTQVNFTKIKPRLICQWLLLGWLIMCVLIGLRWPLSNKLMDANEQWSSLVGDYQPIDRLLVYRRANHWYQYNQCEQKAFFSFYSTPEFYFMWRRKAPFNQSWVGEKSQFYPNNARITNHAVIHYLQHHKNWCVLYASLSHFFAPEIKNTKPRLAGALDYVKQHAVRVYSLGSVAFYGKHYWLYVKDSDS